MSERDYVLIEDYCEDIIENCSKKNHFTVQAMADSEAELSLLADQLMDKFKTRFEGQSDNRIVRIKLKENTYMSQALIKILEYLLGEDDKFSPDDISNRNICAEKIPEIRDNPAKIQNWIKSIAIKEFARKNIHLLLIIENYENSALGECHWTAADYGWFRSIHESKTIQPAMSVLFLSTKTAQEISGEIEVGQDSKLYNRILPITLIKEK